MASNKALGNFNDMGIFQTWNTNFSVLPENGKSMCASQSKASPAEINEKAHNVA